ncbi:MAG: hypothetical protein ABSD64_09515 [Terriglobales bacterium]|jgi:hypothetical protein
MADHFRETGQNDRALFFVGAAWDISRHPIFAFNAAMLSFNAGDIMRAKSLLQDYLAAYQGVLKSPALMLAYPEISSEDLEALAVSARSRLAGIEGHT